MRYRKFLSIGLTVLLGFCISSILNRNLYAQSTAAEKPKIRDFGSSLKKIKNKRKDNSRDDKKQNQTADEETIRIKTDLVVSDVLVVNQKGNAILGLKQSDFVVTEDGMPQEISIFSFGENATVPRSIVLIIDYSTSLLPYIKNSIQAAKLLVDKLNPQDRIAIVTDDVELLLDFTKDKTLLKKTLNSLEEKTLSIRNGGDSKQFSALLAVLNEMFDEEDIRPIVIFQTDGDEIGLLKSDDDTVPLTKEARELLKRFNKRDFGFSDIKKAIEKSRATIYSIIPGIRFTGFSKQERLARAKISLENLFKENFRMRDNIQIENLVTKSQAIEAEDRLALQTAVFRVAELSGGYTDYIEKPEDAENVYSTIFTVIDNRYVIGYYPTNQERNGKRRNVKIEVRNHPEYLVMGRKTYFAPEDKD
jgi:VWFA-related protein